MVDKELENTSEMSSILQEIKIVLDTARNNVAREVNNELLSAYWNVGRIICEYEQSVPDRADYGKQTLKMLSVELTKEFGKGFSRSNLQNMRQFYLTYEKCQTLSGKLSWSHYCELLSISDTDKRSFYEKLVELFNLTVQIRNVSGKLDEDYIISPVADASGKFFCSDVQNAQMPVDTDANAAFNIARKGLLVVGRVQSSEPGAKIKMGISNVDWFNYIQK